MDRSVRFYRDLLGFDRLGSPDVGAGSSKVPAGTR
jgi:hypothetical protein